MIDDISQEATPATAQSIGGGSWHTLFAEYPRYPISRNPVLNHAFNYAVVSAAELHPSSVTRLGAYIITRGPRGWAERNHDTGRSRKPSTTSL